MKERRKAVRKKPPDFIKVKKKVGKTAPSAANATKTQFTYKAIHVPQQHLHIHEEKQHSTTATTAAERIEHREEVHQLIAKLHHYSAAVRRESVNRLHTVIQSHPSVMQMEMAAIMEHTVEMMIDTDKTVRQAVVVVYSTLFPLVSASCMSPFIQLLLGYVCTAMSHIDKSISIFALNYLDLLITHYPSLLWASHLSVLPSFLPMMQDRHNIMPKQQTTQTNSKSSDKQKTGAMTLGTHYRLQLLRTIERFLSLCPTATTPTTTAARTDTAVHSNLLHVPAHYTSSASYAAKLRAVLHGKSSTVSHSPSSGLLGLLAPLADSQRQIPLKYQRRGGLAAGKKSVISSTNDEPITNATAAEARGVTVQPPRAGSTTTSSAVPAASLLTFLSSLTPLLIEHWMEALAGDLSLLNQTTMTSDSYQCLNHCVSILHLILSISNQQLRADLVTSSSCTPTPTTNDTWLLQPHLVALNRHVFSCFPLVVDRVSPSSVDTSIVASINNHLAHIISGFLPEICTEQTAATVDALQTSADQNVGTNDKQPAKKRKTSSEADLFEQWTSMILEYIGQAFITAAKQNQQREHSDQVDDNSIPSTTAHIAATSVAMPTAVVNAPATKRRKRGASSAQLHAADPSDLLPLLLLLLPRLSVKRQVCILETFTAYYMSLHCLAPAKRDCLQFITQLLQVPHGFSWMRFEVAHHWLHSLPVFLISLQSHSPDTSRMILQLLLDCARCYHGSMLEINTLQPALLRFFTNNNSFFDLSTDHQLLSLSLLYFFSALDPCLLSLFARAVNQQTVSDSVANMMLELVVSHAPALLFLCLFVLLVYGLANLISFLLSCLSSHRHTTPDHSTMQPLSRFSLVEPHLRSITRTSTLLLSNNIVPVRNAELILLVLLPTLIGCMKQAISLQCHDELHNHTTALPAATTQERSLALTPATIILIILTIGGEMQIESDVAPQPSNASPSLPPELNDALSDLLQSYLLAEHQSKQTSTDRRSASHANQQHHRDIAIPYQLCFRLFLAWPSFALQFLKRMLFANTTTTAAGSGQALMPPAFVAHFLQLCLSHVPLRTFLTTDEVTICVLQSVVDLHDASLPIAGLANLRALCLLLFGVRAEKCFQAAQVESGEGG